jgi:hypothetical protein
MHKDYLEFIDAYYYLIIVAYFQNYLEFKKVKLYVIKVYGLIELIAYYYQEIMSAILKASREGTKNLSEGGAVCGWVINREVGSQVYFDMRIGVIRD